MEDLYKKDCIRTSTGLYINVFEPSEDMICIEDIAHSLAYQCRFGGHLPAFYSVAQHSWMCAMGVTPLYQLEALMHDASEAYLLDMPKPIKDRLPDYQKIEHNLMKVIAKKFGFEYPKSDVVNVVDVEMLEYEWHRIMLGNNHRECWSPEKAKKEFLTLYNDIS